MNTLRLRVSALLLVGWCAAMGGCAGDVGGTENLDVGVKSNAVIDGQLAQDGDFTAIVRLWTQVGNVEFRQFCTGVLLRNNVVLTAAHCLQTDAEEAAAGWPDFSSASQVAVSTGLGGFWTTGVNRAPSFAPGGRDLAAFRLVDGLPVSTGGRVVTDGFLHLMWHAFEGAEQAIAGYGSIDGNVSSDICQYRSIRTGERLRGCLDDPLQLSIGFGGTAIENERVIVVGIDAANGDSGGPVFAVNDAAEAADLPLVGINSLAHACKGLSGPECGAVAIRVLDVETWVHSQ